jgi:DNA-binding CsgD family transcriptional regulator
MDRRRSSVVVPEIYKATVDSSHWDYVLETIAKITSSKTACLYHFDKNVGMVNTVAQYGCPPHLVHNYNAQFARLDTFFDETSDSPVTGETRHQFICPSSNHFDELDPETYDEWMKPYDIHHIGRVQFINTDSATASISLLRDEAAGCWSEGDIRVIDEIVPHLKRAMDIHAEFTRLRLKQDALIQGLDRLVIGLILYDQHAESVYVNPTAKEIVKSHPALALNEKGLFLYHAEDNRQLRQTILRTATIDSDDSWKQSVSIGITHPDVPAPLPLLVTPMHAHLLTTDVDYEGARVAVFISDPNMAQPISVDNLVSVYKLTPSEAQVAISIANGHSVESIAKKSNHSAHTIRSQLKSTFKKTGVSRQSELIKLLLTGPFAHRRRSNSG